MENPCIHDSHKNVVEVDKEEGVKRGEQNVLSLQSGRVERGLKDIEKQYTLVLILVAMICTVNITEVVEGEGGKTEKKSGSHINGSHKSGQDKDNNMGILGKIFSLVCRN